MESKTAPAIPAPANFPHGVLISGSAVIKDSAAPQVRVRLDGNEGRVSIFKSGAGGELQVADRADQASIWLLGGSGTIVGSGDLLVGKELNGGGRAIHIGGDPGEISVYHFLGPDLGTQRSLHFHGQTAQLTVGMEHQGGSITIKNPGGTDAIRMATQQRARIEVGESNAPGEIVVRDGQGREQIRIDGTTGDIVLGNADCAEEFPVSDQGLVEPGTVMILGSDGLLRPSDNDYDTRAVGIVSGGCGRGAGIILGKQARNSPTAPVALVGTVYCKVTAEPTAIQVGDLLTSSAMSGHAMVATDLSRTPGAIIGKALGGLAAGTGLVPVLVMLR
jgi:hypothetical protein